MNPINNDYWVNCSDAKSVLETLSFPPSVSAKAVSENLEKVPRIWEVECPGGPR